MGLPQSQPPSCTCKIGKTWGKASCFSVSPNEHHQGGLSLVKGRPCLGSPAQHSSAPAPGSADGGSARVAGPGEQLNCRSGWEGAAGDRGEWVRACSQGRGKKRRQSLYSSPRPSLPRRSLPRRQWGFLFAQKAPATRGLGGRTWPLLHMQRKGGEHMAGSDRQGSASVFKPLKSRVCIH